MSQSNGNSRMLTIRQQGALANLLEGSSITAAARKVGVRRETLHTWMKQPVFLREYRDGCEKLRHEIESKMIMMANKATSVIDQALDAGNTKAAMDIIKLVNRGRPEIDLSKHQSDAGVDRMIHEEIEKNRAGRNRSRKGDSSHGDNGKKGPQSHVGLQDDQNLSKTT